MHLRLLPGQVQVPGLESLHAFVPRAFAEKSIILQLLNAAAGKDCTKDSDDLDLAYLLLTKHSDHDSWATWEAQPVKVVPQVETVDTLRSMQVCPGQGGPGCPHSRRPLLPPHLPPW